MNQFVCCRSKGTVGAIAIDQNGTVASATSTGGLNFKMIGRVGDVPCIGITNKIIFANVFLIMHAIISYLPV